MGGVKRSKRGGKVQGDAPLFHFFLFLLPTPVQQPSNPAPSTLFPSSLQARKDSPPVERQDTHTGLHAFLHLINNTSTRSHYIMSTPPHNGDAKTLGQDNNLDTILDNDLDAMIANSISQPNSIPPPSPTPGSSDLFASSGPTLSSQQELSPHETSWSPSQPQHQDDLASSIRPNSSLFQPSVQQHQPGMSPAIQKRGPSLGLALGGSSFRRKPLFGPDDDDNDDRNDRPQKSVKGKGKKDKAFQDLTQSPDDDPELLGERRDGEEDHIEEDEEEEDANSETPLHPQETIRGLE